MGLNKQVLLIDMDGVVADFDDAYKKSLEKTPGIKFPQSQYKFFENIEPIKDSIKSIKELEEYYDILILTRPSVINNPTLNHIHFGKGNFKNWKNITVYLKNMFYDV